jgi:glycosyltransferase involved in cell wall biosynthesis
MSNPKNSPMISVVIPVYGSPESLHELIARLVVALETISNSFEIVLVDDASPDNSWQIISELSEAEPRVLGIRLSRNFGQHPAIAAGLQQSRGEWVVVMDCDLQDRPEEIPNLYHKAMEGFDQVVAVRRNRQDVFGKRFVSKLYVRFLSYLSERPINAAVGNFGIYSRQVIQVITSLEEQGRTFGLLALWAGFRRYELEVEHNARPYGSSSYSFRSLLRLGLLGIISHSDKPLRLTVKAGAYLATAALAGAFWIAIRYLIWGHTAVGWSSVMVSIAFMTGVLLGSIGVTGLYVGQIFTEVKKRPTFIVWEHTNGSSSDTSTSE